MCKYLRYGHKIVLAWISNNLSNREQRMVHLNNVTDVFYIRMSTVGTTAASVEGCGAGTLPADSALSSTPMTAYSVGIRR